MHMPARSLPPVDSTPAFADALLVAAAHEAEALTHLEAAASWFTARSGTDPMPGLEGMHAVGSALHVLSLALARAEVAGVPRDAIRDAVAGVRAVQATSPFARHIQTWPRGYKGDFEVIGQIIARTNLAPPDTLAYWIEEHALHSPVTQQHRNKVQHQARQICDTLSERPDARILVIACGTAPDLRLVPRPMLARARVVLNDGDRDALECCKADVSAIVPGVTLVEGNLFASLRRFKALGPFDLVLAGGLFDYLPDRAATTLLRAAHASWLAPGGRMFFTNIAEGNPFRLWCEYLADWPLIERSVADVHRLLALSDWPSLNVHITREETGLALLITAHQPR